MNLFNLKKGLVFKGDKSLWYVVIGLMLASIMVVYSSTGSLAYRVHSGNTSYFLIKQVILMLGCLGVILVLQSIHYKYFLSFAKIILGMSFIFLLWAKFAGTTLNDAGRWVTIPGIGFTFQPSEMAKLGVIMYCARVISFYQNEQFCEDNALKKILLVVGPVIFLIFMENFSTSLLLGLVCLAMLFVGRLRIKLIAISVGALIVGMLVLLALAFTVPKVAEIGRVATVKSRIVNFLNPETVKSDDSYQSDQAKLRWRKEDW